jgi:hypothetical protein
MRRFLLASLILCLSTSSGCMVLDEMDAAAAKMPTSKKEKLAKKKSREAGRQQATAGATAENPIVEQTKEWWKRASSLAPTELEASIVSCRLSGGTQFMSRDDCLARGGTPGRASG